LHVFIAPRVMGGAEAPSPVEGQGVARVCESLSIDAPQWRDSGGDLYLSGRVARNSAG
jgi:diaminohydroxyphosphoribosylaminopyrimidine deaminase/5-amino-6-(5-phosphoribosylamino)uracil reductase